MNRNFRLRQSIEFMRVRRFGKSYAHPLLVLVVLRMPDDQIKVGVTAGKSVGNAVQRNRAKRMLREAARSLLPNIKPGVSIVLIARAPILKASLTQITEALRNLYFKGNVLVNNDSGSSARD